MNQNDLTPDDFGQMNAAAQQVFEGLAKKIQGRFPALNVFFRHSATERFPLYSYLTIEDKARPDIDPAVVGVDVRVDTGKILIQAHIMGEETGKGHYSRPKRELPFASDHALVLQEVVNAAQQLADNTVPVLERVFRRARPVLPIQDATVPEAARKLNV